MSKQTQICSQKQLQYLLKTGAIDGEDSFALISSSYPLTMEQADRILHSFYAYEDLDYDCPGRSLTPELARSMARDIRAHSGVPHWYFVCDGGVRRSAAICCAALRYWGREQEELEIWGNPQKEPNVLVYTMVCEALGIAVADEDLDYRIHVNRSAIRAALGRR